MPEKVTKKQIIEYLKTPYLFLYVEKDSTRHSDTAIAITANPLANAWRVSWDEPTFLTSDFRLVMAMVKDYNLLNNKSWGDWKYEINKPAVQHNHPTSWTHMQTLLRNNHHLVYRTPPYNYDYSIYVYREKDGWHFSIDNFVNYVHLNKLADVMSNIRRLSDKYCLSASDWHYLEGKE